MKHLKEAIEEAIDGAGIKPSLNQEAAIVLWGSVVGGTIASVTKAERVDFGVLVVSVKTSVWRQELHMKKEDIKNKLNKKIGTKAIKEINFI